MDALDALLEPVAYVFTSAYLVTAILLGSWAVLWVVGHLRRQEWTGENLKKVALLVCLVALVGAVGDIMWFFVFAGRLYVDPDPIVAFSPFIPFSVDSASGGHLLGGTTWVQAVLLWTAFATVCWITAWVVYRRIRLRALPALDRLWGASAARTVAAPGKDAA